MRALPPIIALATLGLGIFAAVEHVWTLAGIAVVVLLIEVFFVPRMTGPFLISGKRFRFQGTFSPPSGPTPSPPPGTALQAPPQPPALPGTIQSNGDPPA